MKTVAVITGGAGGMGLATAKILGQEHTIILSDVNNDNLQSAKKELTQAGVTCITAVCDITSRSDVEDLAEEAAKHGTVKAVIHAAGVSPSMASAQDIMTINALGTIHVNEVFHTQATEGLAVVNVASMAGHMLPGWLVPSRSFKYAHSNTSLFMKKMLRRTRLFPAKLRAGISYSISKSFVIWYSKVLAADFGKKGARVLSVSPGSFDTAMGKLEKDAGAEKMLDHAAIKRFGRPEEIAEVLAFCVNDKASYLTGTDILCDGGVIAGMKKR